MPQKTDYNTSEAVTVQITLYTCAILRALTQDTISKQ